MSPNGWTDDFLCTEWFKKCFIPQATARKVSSAPILLIYDGHGSHNTAELIELAREHHIILFCLPPHTTHKLQPLDVGVFGPFSRAWLDRCDEYVDEYGEEMPREDFVKEYMAIRAKTFKPQTILSAFKKCGIRPLNCGVFNDEDFAPSITTSTTATHVPPSFRVPDIPRAPGSDFNDDECCPACSRAEDSDGESAPEDEDSLPHHRHLHTCQFAEIPQNSEYPPTTMPPRMNVSPSPQASMSSLGLQPKEISPALFYRSTSPRRPSQPRTLEKRAAQLEQENKRLRTERDEACVHAALVYHEFNSLKRKSNSKSNRAPKKRKLNAKARCLTSAEGLAEAREAERLRLEKERKREEAAAKRTADEAERLKSRLALDPDTPFIGVLSSKNKSQLQDIAFTLHLPTDNKLTKENLISSINDHFDKHPSLKTTPRYEQIFNSRRRAAPPPSSVSQPLPTFLPHGPHFWPSVPYTTPISTGNAPHFPTHHTQFAYQPNFPSSSAAYQPQIDPTLLHGA